jgi:hypothetical protein
MPSPERVDALRVFRTTLCETTTHATRALSHAGGTTDDKIVEHVLPMLKLQLSVHDRERYLNDEIERSIRRRIAVVARIRPVVFDGQYDAFSDDLMALYVIRFMPGHTISFARAELSHFIGWRDLHVHNRREVQQRDDSDENLFAALKHVMTPRPGFRGADAMRFLQREAGLDPDHLPHVEPCVEPQEHDADEA